MKSFASIFIVVLHSLIASLSVPEAYPAIIEKLVYFKDDEIKVFYGSPVGNGTKVRWVMPILFEDEYHKARAVYEMSFINCLPNPEDAKDAESVYIRVSDIDIKFKNKFCLECQIFSSIINNTNREKKYIVIREVDVSNVYYPEIFVAAVYSNFKETDRERLLDFIRLKFQNKGELRDLTIHSAPRQLASLKQDLEIIEQRKVCTEIEGRNCYFDINHCYIKDDPWKSYYVVTISSDSIKTFAPEKSVLLRIDSGCGSGQIYNDPLCDCSEQLHQGLASMLHSGTENSLLIHIPAQDGRGFGIAPKAETEIYKRGGIGRVNRTEPLDTVQAAILLYGTRDFDIRTYDGCVKILRMSKIQIVDCVTDNKEKIKTLNDFGFAVNRIKTHTEKETCMHHIAAKKNTQYYFRD